MLETSLGLIKIQSVEDEHRCPRFRRPQGHGDVASWISKVSVSVNISGFTLALLDKSVSQPVSDGNIVSLIAPVPSSSAV